MLNKIIMLKTKSGAEDGFTVKMYRENEVYELNDYLYNIFKKK
jgi:hypothetical protein